MPFDQFDALCMRLALEFETDVRAKFGPETSAVKLLDEYYEQVKMGLREPIPPLTAA